MLAFSLRAALTVGVVIDHEECEVALVDMSARVLDYARATYPRYSEPHEVGAIVAMHLEALCRRNGVDESTLIGTGVAVPGLIDSRTGVVKIAANLGWKNVQLRSLFEQKLHLPTRVEHLGKAKARAEAIWGRGVGHQNFVCLEIGSGIGAGVIINGRTLKGTTLSAGEVGHNVLDPRGPRCACGLNGCWEVFCASSAILHRLAKQLSSVGASSSSVSPTSSLGELGRAAQLGDPVALRVVDETAEYMARGLANVIWNFDPELIILSGTVVRECPILIEATQQALRRLEAVRSLDIPLVAPTHEAHEGVIAASAIISVRYLQKLASE